MQAPAAWQRWPCGPLKFHRSAPVGPGAAAQSAPPGRESSSHAPANTLLLFNLMPHQAHALSTDIIGPSSIRLIHEQCMKVGSDAEVRSEGGQSWKRYWSVDLAQGLSQKTHHDAFPDLGGWRTKLLLGGLGQGGVQQL